MCFDKFSKLLRNIFSPSIYHRHAIGGEPHRLVDVKIVDGLHQADTAHLKEVVHTLPSALEPLEHRQHQPQIAADQLLPRRLVAGLGTAQQRHHLVVFQHRQSGCVDAADLYLPPHERPSFHCDSGSISRRGSGYSAGRNVPGNDSMGQAARRIDCNGVSAMLCKFSMLRRKEVINLCDGSRLGFVGDLDIQVPEGTVKGIIVFGPCRFFGLFGRGEDFYIPWECIRKFGDDIILIDKPFQKRQPPPPRRKKGWFG